MPKSVPTPRWGTADALKLRTPLVGAQGYTTFPLHKPVVGQNIVLDAVSAYRAFIPTYVLPSRLIQLHFLQIYPDFRRWNVY